MFHVATLFTPAIIAAGDPPKPGPAFGPANGYTTYYSAAISPLQYGIAVGVLSIVIIAFCAGIIYLSRARKAIGAQYQSPLSLGRFALYIATASYLVLLSKFLFGYAHAATSSGTGVWVPNQMGLLNVPIRYVDWAITVPLLVLALLTISSLRAADKSTTRTWAIIAAFLMIVTGYIGGVAIDTGHNLAARLGWGGVSTVFLIIVYAILIHALRTTSKDLTTEASAAYRRATGLLMSVWFVYPLVYALTGFFTTTNWIIGYQVALAIADMLAKVGFGILVLRVAQVRTAADNLAVMAASQRATTDARSN